MSFWGTLGKIGAGIAAPFTGGLSLAAIPAIGAAEGAAHGGGWKGALKGGVIGTGEAMIPFGLSKIPGVKNLGGSFVSKLLGHGAADSASGELAGMRAGIQGVNSQLSGGGTGSAIGSLLKGLTKGDSNPDGTASPASDAGNLLSNYAQGEAANRGAKGLAYQNYDKLMLDAAQNRREDESAGMKNLQHAAYISSGGRPYTPPVINGQALPSFGFGPRATTDQEKQGADLLSAAMLKRLGPDGSYTPTDAEKYVNEGKGEKAAKYGGLASNGLDIAKRIFHF